MRRYFLDWAYRFRDKEVIEFESLLVGVRQAPPMWLVMTAYSFSLKVDDVYIPVFIEKLIVSVVADYGGRCAIGDGDV